MLGETYGQYNVCFDPFFKAIKIKMNSEMAAIKMILQKWSFMDMENNNAMNKIMPDKKILDKLATYN